MNNLVLEKCSAILRASCKYLALIWAYILIIILSSLCPTCACRSLIERGDLPKEQYFKRYSRKKDGTLCGGFKKNRAFQGSRNRHMRPAWLLTARREWAEINNAHFKAHGMAIRISEKSLKNQGIERPPQKHLGYKTVRDAKYGKINQEYKYYESLKDLTKELATLNDSIKQVKVESERKIEAITVEWNNECKRIQEWKNKYADKPPAQKSAQSLSSSETVINGMLHFVCTDKIIKKTRAETSFATRLVLQHQNYSFGK